MLRNGRLSDAELRPDDCDDLPRRLLFVEEQFEDPPADRVTEDIESVHVATVSLLPYIRQHLYLSHGSAAPSIATTKARSGAKVIARGDPATSLDFISSAEPDALGRAFTGVA